MSEPVYISNIKIERKEGPLRFAYLPAEEKPVCFGVHGAIAKHYGVNPEISEPHATTLDYVIAAAGGWLTGTFGGALEARKISAGNKRLTSDVRGEVELEDNVLVIKRIHVLYHLKAPKAAMETIKRVHEMHAKHCPVYRSLHKAIDITTDFQVEFINWCC